LSGKLVKGKVDRGGVFLEGSRQMLEEGSGDDLRQALEGQAAFTMTYPEADKMVVYFSMPVEIQGRSLGVIRYQVDASASYVKVAWTERLVYQMTAVVFVLVFCVLIIFTGRCGFIGGSAKRQAQGLTEAWAEGKTAVKAVLPRERILDMMMTALVHRGPDQGKKWMSEHAALGFRRLAIIDQQGSAQPMVNEAGDKVLVFNGEIYNYKELRRELILPHPAYRKELNPEALEQYLSFQYSAMEKTFFKGIRQLRPGSILKYRKNDFVLEQERYFTPSLLPEGNEGEKTRSEKEWVANLDHVIRDSVQAHMESDAEIGVFLSGGVDSGLVAAEYTGKRAYTVGFGEEGSKCNEIPLARQLADGLELKHKDKKISESEFWEAVPEVLYYMDEPLGDPSAVALYFLAREASRQVRVVVSGEGADELFGGYRIYCEPNALRLYQKLPIRLRRKIAGAAQRLPMMRGRSFLIRGSMPVEERFIGNANLFSNEERMRLLKHPVGAPSPREFLEEDYTDAEELDEASRMQYIDLLHWLPGDILQKADRMSMAHSVELRVPYLDREVFEVARRLPAKYKQKRQISKYLFRKVAGRYLPKAFSKRQKLGFPIPLERFLTSEEGGEAVSRAFSSPAAEEYFNREVLEELFEKRGSGRGNSNRKLWAVYSFLVWHEIYFPQEEAGRLTAS